MAFQFVLYACATVGFVACPASATVSVGLGVLRACEMRMAARIGAFRRDGCANRRGGNARCAQDEVGTGRRDSIAWGHVPYVVGWGWGPDPYGKRDVWGTDPYGNWVVGDTGTYVFVTMPVNGAI